MEKPFHILHADDDEEDRWIFRDGLTEYDPAIRLTQFEDGIHLLKYIETAPQDTHTHYAIVCDMKMPFLGGLDVLSQVKQIPAWKTIPFIIFSTSSLAQDIRNCMDKGALAFYTKPNTFSDNRLIIKEMILSWKDSTFSNNLMYSQ